MQPLSELDLLTLSIMVMDLITMHGRMKVVDLRREIKAAHNAEIGRVHMTQVVNRLVERNLITRTPVGNGFWYDMPHPSTKRPGRL